MGGSNGLGWVDPRVQNTFCPISYRFLKISLVKFDFKKYIVSTIKKNELAHIMGQNAHLYFSVPTFEIRLLHNGQFMHSREP